MTDVNVIGQPISARAIIDELNGNEKIPLGVNGNKATTPNQLKDFIGAGDHVIKGSFTFQGTAAELLAWPGLVLDTHVLEIPRLSSVCYNARLVITRITDTLIPPDVTNVVPVNFNVSSTADIGCIVTTDNGDYIQGIEGSIHGARATTFIPQFENNGYGATGGNLTGMLVSLNGNNAGYQPFGLLVDTIETADDDTPAGTFVTTLMVVPGMAVPTIYNGDAISERPLEDLSGTYHYTLTLVKDVLDIDIPNKPVDLDIAGSRKRTIAYTPRSRYQFGSAPVDYMGLCLDPDASTVLRFTINNTTPVVLTLPAKAYITSTDLTQLNNSLSTYGLVIGTVSAGGVYGVTLHATATSVTSVTFDAIPEGGFLGSGKSNSLECIFGLAGRSFTFPVA